MPTTRLRLTAGATGRWSSYLKKEDGSRIPKADIDGIHVTMVNTATGATVNGRTAQDVWNGGNGAHGFQVAETTDADGNNVTQLGWDIEAADTAIAVSGERVEDHRARVKIEYHQGSPAVGKVLLHDVRLHCVDIGGIIEFEDVQERLPGLVDGARPIIEDMIESFMMRAEDISDRFFPIRQYTEYRTPFIGSRTLYLRAFPIISIDEVKEELNQDWDSTDPTDADDYTVDKEWGWLQFRWRDSLFASRAGTAPNSVRIKYTGGLYHDAGDVPPDVRDAAIEQVCYWWQRRNNLGLSSVSLDGQSITVYATQDLLPKVKALFNSTRYRRARI